MNLILFIYFCKNLFRFEILKNAKNKKNNFMKNLK